MLRHSYKGLALGAGLGLMVGACARPSPLAYSSRIRSGDIRARLDASYVRPLPSSSEPYVIDYTDPYRPLFEEDPSDPSLGRVGLWAAKEAVSTLSPDHPLRIASDEVRRAEEGIEGFFDTLLPLAWEFDYTGNGFNVTVPFPD